jgi:hypothetical protein
LRLNMHVDESRARERSLVTLTVGSERHAYRVQPVLQCPGVARGIAGPSARVPVRRAGTGGSQPGPFSMVTVLGTVMSPGRVPKQNGRVPTPRIVSDGDGVPPTGLTEIRWQPHRTRAECGLDR